MANSDRPDTAYPFLSEEWMEAARSIRTRYEDQVPEVEIDLRINQVVHDVPFGEGEVRCYLDTSTGQVVMELGELEDADVTITTDYITARGIFVDQDPTIAMRAFMEGRVKIQGDMMKLMAMQTMLPANDFTVAIAEEIKSITAHPDDEVEPEVQHELEPGDD